MNRLQFSLPALIVAFVLVIFAGSVLAQSSDRDNPSPLASGEIKGNLYNAGEENFYSFTAGPGELTITIDVKAKSGEIGVLNFELLDQSAANALICCEFAQADGGKTGRTVKSIKLTKRQTVILHTTNGPVGGGTFLIRLTGAAVFGGKAATGGGAVTPGNTRSENQIDVPASGILHIKMKDGTTKTINLNLVREISVEP
jgi:hypothetical protein